MTTIPTPVPKTEAQQLREALIHHLIATGCPRLGTDPVQEATRVLARMTPVDLVLLEAEMKLRRGSEPQNTFEYRPYDR